MGLVRHILSVRERCFRLPGGILNCNGGGNMYTQEVIDHFLNPRNLGEIEEADGVGQAIDWESGSLCVFYVKLTAGRISQSGYRVSGCPNTIAACSVASELILGLTPAEAMTVGERDVERVLRWRENEYPLSTALVLEALHQALSMAEQRQKKQRW